MKYTGNEANFFPAVLMAGSAGETERVWTGIHVFDNVSPAYLHKWNRSIFHPLQKKLLVVSLPNWETVTDQICQQIHVSKPEKWFPHLWLVVYGVCTRQYLFPFSGGLGKPRELVFNNHKWREAAVLYQTFFPSSPCGSSQFTNKKRFMYIYSENTC